jgi:hypothetical protein
MKHLLQPSASLLMKLGSIIRHFEELTSSKAHSLDKAAIESLLSDSDVKEWFEEMDKQALLPVKR